MAIEHGTGDALESRFEGFSGRGSTHIILQTAQEAKPVPDGRSGSFRPHSRPVHGREPSVVDTLPGIRRLDTNPTANPGGTHS